MHKCVYQEKRVVNKRFLTLNKNRDYSSRSNRKPILRPFSLIDIRSRATSRRPFAAVRRLPTRLSSSDTGRQWPRWSVMRGSGSVEHDPINRPFRLLVILWAFWRARGFLKPTDAELVLLRRFNMRNDSA